MPLNEDTAYDFLSCGHFRILAAGIVEGADKFPGEANRHRFRIDFRTAYFFHAHLLTLCGYKCIYCDRTDKARGFSSCPALTTTIY